MGTQRTKLALAACQGLTDLEIANRGIGGFKKMINRKREYAKAARSLAKALEGAEAEKKDLLAQLSKANQTIAALEQFDAPIADVTQAADVLATFKTQ